MGFLDSFRSRLLSALGILSVLTGCSSGVIKVVVDNPLDMDRHPEMVELCLEDVAAGLSLASDEEFVIRDRGGKEIPYQITGDSKVIFQVSMPAGAEETFSISKGKPSGYESLVFGKHYPGKEDDFAWENDKVGFRVYGHKQDVASGYDLFCKRGTHLPVLERLYANEVKGSDAWKRYHELEAMDPDAAFRFKMDTLSYHVDHGYGMDVYAVGPTLGAGIAALMKDDTIAYPYCYETYEILEAGPLRFSVRFTFRPIACGNDKEILETRVITLDAGSYLNRTVVSYENVSEAGEIVAGIVLREDGGEPAADVEKGYISYPAPTQNHDTTQDVDNGIIYVGHVYPDPIKEAKVSHGHIMTVSSYQPGVDFCYYWGFGWDHSDVLSHEQWNSYLETFSMQLRNPLVVYMK